MDERKAQLKQLLRMAVTMTVRTMPAAAASEPRPYKSLLTEGCAASGKDFNDQGALYDYYQTMLVGLPNLADSLAVLKQTVYEQKQYTLPQIIDMLEKYEVRRCFYGHLHGGSHKLAMEGLWDGVEFRRVAADYIGFTPYRVI